MPFAPLGLAGEAAVPEALIPSKLIPKPEFTKLARRELIFLAVFAPPTNLVERVGPLVTARATAATPAAKAGTTNNPLGSFHFTGLWTPNI